MALGIPNIDVPSNYLSVLYKLNLPQSGNTTHIKINMHYSSFPYKSFKVMYLAISSSVNYLKVNYKEFTSNEILSLNTVPTGSSTRIVQGNFNLYVTVDSSSSLVIIPFVTGLRIYSNAGDYQFSITFTKNNDTNIFFNATCYMTTTVN